MWLCLLILLKMLSSYPDLQWENTSSLEMTAFYTRGAYHGSFL